jgi:hypothetical protein
LGFHPPKLWPKRKSVDLEVRMGLNRISPPFYRLNQE